LKMIVCGIDEAGRGPLAGPVCAAAVILGDKIPHDILNDSKKLSAKKRTKLQQLITGEAAVWGIGWASHTEIDSLNILQASLLAMKRAYMEMMEKCIREQILPLGASVTVITDGTYAPDCSVPDDFEITVKTMIKADALVPAVMAASILAKTTRDHYMDEMALKYPQYGYEKHKGYPTKLHFEMIRKYGPSPIQRLSFRVK